MASLIAQNSSGSVESGGPGNPSSLHHNPHNNHLNNLSHYSNNAHAFHPQQLQQHQQSQHLQHQPNSILVDQNSWDYYARQQQDHQNSQQQQHQQQQQQQNQSSQQQQQQEDESNSDSITSANNSNSNYTRPWEMETKDTKGFEPFSKLPSFQSQFHGYNETNGLMPDGTVLSPPQPVPVIISPSSGSPRQGGPQLTQLTSINTLQPPPPPSRATAVGLSALTTPNFHTLSATAVNSPGRPYPLVPAPIQARDITTMNQPYLDDRHLQLYQPITTFPSQNLVTLIKKENYDLDTGLIGGGGVGLVGNGMHTPTYDSSMMIDGSGVGNNGGYHHTNTTQHQTVTASTTTPIKIKKELSSPIARVDARKKERRKNRASSLESSAESESSAMDVDPSNPGQVDAVSSTANFKSPLNTTGMSDCSDINGSKETKKKRKRCGECIGCQRKDNCGECAPCRNDKSHQICKQRRCEKLTEKKIIYGTDGQVVRTESRRGRGKGRGASTGTRGRKPGISSAKLNKLNSAISPRNQQQQTNLALSPAPATVLPHPSPNTTTGSNPLSLGGGNNITSITVQIQNQQQQHQQQQQQPLHQQQHQQQQQQQQQVHQQQQQQAVQSSQQQVHQQSHHISAQIHTMKDQPQQPMAPMAFYPTWQADPSQGWQNQFIQQIPQNSPAITSLNSLEFQPQSYSYQPPNGYVQTGLGFDPNYGRTYAAPVQRYEFQTQQIASPINQVSLQSVSFAPTVTYAGQVSTAPAPPPVVLSNSSAAAAQQHQLQVGAASDLNKTMSGNDTPGYPRVSSVPPRSLNCNGYSGDFSGNQATGPQAVAQQSAGAGGSASATTGQQQSSNSNAQQTQQQSSSPMHPPSTQGSQNQQQQSSQQVPQSPTRGHMQQQQQQQQQRHVSQSPNHVPQSPSGHSSSSNSSNNMQQYPIPPSPNHNSQQMLHNPHQGMHTPNQQQQQQQQSQPNHISSPSHAQMSQDWNWNNQNQQQPGAPGEMFNQAERVNLNTRIKSMILRKNDPKDIGQGADVQMQAPTGPSATHGQSQNQTGHFLSYSHHLRGDSAMNASGSSVPQQQQQQQQQAHQQSSASAAAAAAAANAALTEPHGGGGDQIWKPQGHSFKKPPSSFQNSDQPHHQPQHHTTSHSSKSKKKSHSSNDVEKNSNDPGGGSSLHHHHSQQHGHHHQRGSPHHQLDIKTEKSSYPPMSGYGQHPDPNACYPGMNPQGQYPMIKQEPGLMPPQNNKMEGYERNYQNFIQYADYCQNEVQPAGGNNASQQQQQQHQQQQQQQHQQQQQQQQQDYQQQHGYQNPAASYYGAGYQHQNNYQQNFSPSYQHPPPPLPPHSSSASTPSSFGCPPSSNSTKSSSSKGGHSLMDLDRKHDQSNLSMPMNYEKEIPAHAYPIPPNRYSMMQGADKAAELHASEEVDKITGYPFLGEGGPAAIKNIIGFSCCRQGGTRVPTIEHLKDGSCMGMQTKDEILDDEEEETDENGEPKAPSSKKKNASDDGASEESAPAEVVVKRETINPMFDTTDRLEKGNKAEIPECDCFSSDKNPPEPGSYYTHLGSSATLAELRKEIEDRCGISGRQLRIEKIVYTGKEGKTTQGCPVAKWIIRRADPEEKILVVVKKRQGHKCAAAFIVVAMVAWDGMPRQEADNAYKNLIGKLNKYGLPTTRRCATNENRTCACQGLDPETSGASYSFGCSWSMYYNGCKYARSKTVRKFRLSVKNEESAIEDHMNLLATVLAPLFKQIAPRSYDNQTKYEKEAPDCRLGLKPGKPFSGVTACLDFCAHAHRDLHNMQDGCTVQVALLKPSNRDGRQPDDEQFHVLPLYTMDATDEFDSAEGQKEKHRTGAVQVLDKYPCEVRVRSTPLVPCRRHGKKRKDGEDGVEGATAAVPPQQTTPQPPPVTPNPPPPTKKESSKSRSKSKQNQQAQQQQQLNPPSTPSAPPSTPSPRCQTPVTNNPSPAGSAFSTPPVNNGHNGGNNNLMSSNSSLMNMATMIDTFTDAQLQSNQISSTVLDSPYSYDYQTGSYIDSRNYYGNWPPPPSAHPAGAPHPVSAQHPAAQHPAAQHPVTQHPAAQHPAAQHPAAQHPVAQQHPVATNLLTPPNTPMTPTTPNSHHHQVPLPPAATAVQHHDGYGNFNSHLPPVGNQLTQLQDVRGDVKSRGGSEENPDSTTIVNNLSESSKLTPLTPITNLGPPTLEEGFVKPKPPPDYQYSQYPNNYQMYPPPPPTYSPYDAYNNMNYNYGYHHQPYSPYSMYPQQTPPPTPPPPSPNWNMYPPSTSTQHPLPPHAAAAAAMHHQQAAYTPTALPPVTHTPHAHHQQTSLPPQQQQHPHHHHLQSLSQSPLHHHQQQSQAQQQQHQQHQAPSGAQSKHSQLPQQQQQQQQPQMVTPPLQQPPPVQQPPPQTDLSPPPNGAGGATVKAEPIGEVTEINENLEAFQDPQMGGVAIALNHGSVLIECAKHEMHSTTAVKRPNRHHPTRMTLIFYQHRNLNRTRHGIDEWEEKMRVKKINTEADAKAKEEGQTKIKKEPLDEDELDELGECSGGASGGSSSNRKEGSSSKSDGGHQQEAKRNKKDGSDSKAKKNSNSNNHEQSKNEKMVLRAPTLTTTSWTTLFPMHPCVVTGPYQEGNSSPSSTTASTQA